MACNSHRSDDRVCLRRTSTIGGTGTQVANIFKVTGSVEILEAHAFIKSVTTLTNLTGLYFDLYDGTNVDEITSSTVGGTLSNAPVNTMIVKNQDVTKVVTCVLTDRGRVTEIPDKHQHQPFTVTQKNGTNTYIRCHYTTTDNPVNFTIEFIVDYKVIDGGKLELA